MTKSLIAISILFFSFLCVFLSNNVLASDTNNNTGININEDINYTQGSDTNVDDNLTDGNITDNSTDKIIIDSNMTDINTSDDANAVETSNDQITIRHNPEQPTPNPNVSNTSNIFIPRSNISNNISNIFNISNNSKNVKSPGFDFLITMISLILIIFLKRKK